MVEFVDGSFLAQMGVPSMHIPIQYALSYPNRHKGIKTDSFNIYNQNLQFLEPTIDDLDKCSNFQRELLQ